MIRIKRLVLASCLIALSSNVAAMQNYYYFLRSNTPEMQPLIEAELKSVKSHSQYINGIITQSYSIDPTGKVDGYVNQPVVDFAKQHHIKLIILVTNKSFDKEPTHQFLLDTAAQAKSISAIVGICKQNHYDGAQLDFENIDITDKERLTHFLVSAAQSLHQNKLQASFAVVPALADGNQISLYQQRKYDHWAGAYDLAALGKAGDYVSIMTYDQHLVGTTPGPYAGYRWLQAVVKHTLQSIPANKISLGIPAYSGHWYTGGKEKISVKTNDISFAEVTKLLQQYPAEVHWNNQDKIHYAIFQRDWLYEYIFIEDAASFKAKLELAKKFKLNGISVFHIGKEDPASWNMFKSV